MSTGGPPAREPKGRGAVQPRPTLSSVTGTGASASIALALLVLVCVFVAVSVPRASLGYRTQVLHRAFRTASSAQTTVLADADITGLTTNYLSALALSVVQGNVAPACAGTACRSPRPPRNGPA